MAATVEPPVSTWQTVLGRLLQGLLVISALTVAAGGIQKRWELVQTLPWQCDELPMLLRFTGIKGQVTNDENASSFDPTLFTLRTGMIRALRPPNDNAAVHTTTNFWTNLTIHAWGMHPWAARLAPFVFSLAAIFVIAWATLAAGGGLTACATAIGLVSLSPLGIIYAAQARGYAEAMLLAPLLLILLDRLRHRPRNIGSAAIAMFAALLLSVGVFSMFVFWVLPVFAMAVLRMPADVPEGEPRRQTRHTVMLIWLAVLAVMAVYTIDRWIPLSLLANRSGETLKDAADVEWFVSATAHALTPAGVFLGIPALLGMVILARSPHRWWASAMVASLLVVVAFGWRQGSVGYVRNLAYWLGPLALLAGLGTERLLMALLDRGHRNLVHATATTILLAGMVVTSSSSVRSAHDLIQPDWGRAMHVLNDQPESVGPRWIAPCLAHHWIINWYRRDDDLRRVLDADPRQEIEFILGTTRNFRGAEVSHREEPGAPVILEVPIPAFITQYPAIEFVDGVRLRRFVATPIRSDDAAEQPTSSIIWLAWIDSNPQSEKWTGFLEGISSLRNQWLPFKPVSTHRGLFRTLVVAAPAAQALVDQLRSAYLPPHADLRAYALSPLPAAPPAATVAAERF